MCISRVVSSAKNPKKTFCEFPDHMPEFSVLIVDGWIVAKHLDKMLLLGFFLCQFTPLTSQCRDISVIQSVRNKFTKRNVLASWDAICGKQR